MQLCEVSNGIEDGALVTPQLIEKYIHCLATHPTDLQVSRGRPNPDEYGYRYAPLKLSNGTQLVTTIICDSRNAARSVMFRLRKADDAFHQPDIAAFTIQQSVQGWDLSHRLVHPDHRESGHGSLLLSTCEQYAAATRIPIVEAFVGQHKLLQWLMKRGYQSPPAAEVLRDVERGELVVGSDDYMYLPNTPVEEVKGYESDWVRRITVSKRVA